MAKLNARGRTEFVRMVKETTHAPIEKCTSCDGTGRYRVSEGVTQACGGCEGKGERKPTCTWERVTRTLMSDRTILEKRDVRFQPDRFDPEGRRHSYGWTVRGKAKEGVDAAKFREIYEKNGFTAAGGSFTSNPQSKDESTT